MLKYMDLLIYTAMMRPVMTRIPIFQDIYCNLGITHVYFVALEMSPQRIVKYVYVAIPECVLQLQATPMFRDDTL